MLGKLIDNFKFLVIETENQVKLTRDLLTDFQDRQLEKIGYKDDYIDNLKTTLENTCFMRIHGEDYMDEKEVNAVRAIHIMSVNLERIADYCVNTARQMDYLSEHAYIRNFDYHGMFDEIEQGLSLINSVLSSRDLSGALDICRTEFNLDALYKASFDKIMEQLHKGREIGNLITVLFMFRYLERIGDSLLNIGEALIFAIIGDRIKIRHFNALQQTLSESGFSGSLSDIDFNSILGSKSGCRIGKVDHENLTGSKTQAIFKEGASSKIKQEKKNIEQWNNLFPGLAPRIFGYYEKYNTASLLVEFLAGCTLDEIILTSPMEIVENTIFILEQTLFGIWEKTLVEKPVKTDYMNQLLSRIKSVYKVHPGLNRESRKMESLCLHSSTDLIRHVEKLEQEIPAPFQIFIHGDFNINNIVYEHETQRIHYIDLYRSKHFDYIQDASVFIISNFRIPVFEKDIRDRLNQVITHFYNAFFRFSKKKNDTTFEIRMALALARSFLTSTRFELNPGFAKEMALRSYYLLERVTQFAQTGKNWEEFTLPQGIMYY